MIEILTDALHRIAYSTDASAYREVPIGVAYPANDGDIIELLSEARNRHTCLIPRAGGTSIAGQVVGNGIVVDVSRHMNNIIELNAAERWARVQPGLVLDELNIACRPHGLFFSPETSTSNRCCLGGMFGNNSCGAHSLVYGSTRHHVLEAHGVLSDGSVEDFKPYTIAQLEERFGPEFWNTVTDNSPLIQQIYAQLIVLALDPDAVRQIELAYPDPSLRRRSCGYAIDEVVVPLAHSKLPFQQRTVNLCPILCGSEGTLAFITEIKVDLDPLPLPVGVAVCAHCDRFDKAFLANLVALKHQAVAIELIDDNILQLSRENGAQQQNRFFVEGEPAAILVIELRGQSREELENAAQALEHDLMYDDRHLVYACTRVWNGDISKVWSLRKAGLGLLSGMKGDAKPIGVIEDTAIAPQRLPDYMADFVTMTERLGTSCVYYGHISTGELHLRPIINIKTEQGLKLFRDVAYETALLVKKHRGSLSGEHGDGRLRGEFIPLLYGQWAYDLMRRLKHVWDADAVMNIGKIVDAPPMDSALRFGVNQRYAIEHELGENKTYFNWRAAFDECRVKNASGVRSQAHALMCSVEQCNGAGDCRKSNLFGGTICPAYRVSRDETRTTRARANVLREILTRGWSSEAFSAVGNKGGSIFSIPELVEVLDSCLACKGCRSECPSNVDMTRLRAEVLQHLHDQCGTPLRSMLVSRMALIERLGAIMPSVYNFFAGNRLTSAIIKKIVKFAPERAIPRLSHHSMSSLVKSDASAHRRPTKGKVYLMADEFTEHQEAALGLTMAQLLRHLGYEVIIPNHVESGRAAISKGNLRLARRFAERNVSLLTNVVTDDTPLVGIEPSCILTFRDEYPDLVAPEHREKARRLAKNCLLYDEFIMREVCAGRISKQDFKDDRVEVWLHGHCHQKSLVGIEKTAQCLRLLPGAEVHVIPSGCCGMAGSFGYEKEHYRTSLAIGEMVLFPAVRRAMASANGTVPTLVAAPGVSCRQQIKDGTGVTAVHPIVILNKWLKQ